MRSLSAVSASASAVERVRLGLYRVPLAEPVSDAKVATGRQRPLEDVHVIVAQITTGEGIEGIGFAYSKRAGGPAIFAHARQLAPLLVGEDPLDIGRLWHKLIWAGASAGREGIAVQAIAAFDIALHDRRAKLMGVPLAKALGAHRDTVRCYDTGGGFLSTPAETLVANAERAIARGIGGIKLKVGGSERDDVARVSAVRKALGDDVVLMVDANQQWDGARARRVGARLAELGLEWIEEPLDAYDVAGHAELRRHLAAPIASGEMLTSPREHIRFLDARALDVVQPDAVRLGGVTPFLRVADRADELGVMVAPHFATELHVHLAAAQPREGWVEYFDWLEPLFNERPEVRGGRIAVPPRPGLGLTLAESAARMREATADTAAS